MIAGRRSSFIICAMVFAAILAALVGAAGARAETFMTVSDVPVDITAKNAAAARDAAIAEAQRLAFDRLIRRLVPGAADQARIRPSAEEIESFVQDFAVQSERTSSVRYIGLFTVRFRTARVRKYLADAGIQGIGDLVQVVVVPVYKGPSGLQLWGPANPWRTAWERGGGGDGPATLILANGDAFDTATLPLSAAEDGDMTALSAMINRYQAAGIVVAVAAPVDPARGPASGLSVSFTTYDASGARGTQSQTVPAVAGELSEATLLRGVAAVSGALEAGWQQSIGVTGSIGLAAPAPGTGDDSAAPLGPVSVYPISMPIAQLGDWVAMRDRLGGTAGVQRLSLDAMARDGVAFTVDFAGDAVAFQAALAGSGYTLVQLAPANAAGPGIFQLRQSGAGRPAGQPADGR